MSLYQHGKGILMIKGKKVEFSNNMLNVTLEDGRIICTPISWYKELQNATLKELNNYHFICANTGIEWENLDCQISIISMFAQDCKHFSA